MAVIKEQLGDIFAPPTPKIASSSVLSPNSSKTPADSIYISLTRCRCLQRQRRLGFALRSLDLFPLRSEGWASWGGKSRLGALMNIYQVHLSKATSPLNVLADSVPPFIELGLRSLLLWEYHRSLLHSSSLQERESPNLCICSAILEAHPILILDAIDFGCPHWAWVRLLSPPVHLKPFSCRQSWQALPMFSFPTRSALFPALLMSTSLSFVSVQSFWFAQHPSDFSWVIRHFQSSPRSRKHSSVVDELPRAVSDVSWREHRERIPLVSQIELVTEGICSAWTESLSIESALRIPRIHMTSPWGLLEATATQN